MKSIGHTYLLYCFRHRSAKTTDVRGFSHVETQVQLEPFFDKCDKRICAHRNPDLGFDSLFAGPIQLGDLAMVFGPFEKPCDLPAVMALLGNRQRLQVTIAAEQDEPFLGGPIISGRGWAAHARR